MCLSPSLGRNKSTNKVVEFPCRQCRECKQARANQWAIRCAKELEQHKDSCFITLTYDDLYNPRVLLKAELQLFVKRLRKRIPPVKIFTCGEYGTKSLRPHYHIILFGWFPDDCIFYKNSDSGYPLYNSKILAELWDYGYSTVQRATSETAGYMALYCGTPRWRLPSPQKYAVEFNTMSHGLGVSSIMADIDNYLKTDKIWYNGFGYRIPQAVLNKKFPVGSLAREIGYKQLKDSRYQEFCEKYPPRDMADVWYLASKKKVKKSL